jgi:hypothetical protein
MGQRKSLGPVIEVEKAMGMRWAIIYIAVSCKFVGFQNWGRLATFCQTIETEQRSTSSVGSLLYRNWSTATNFDMPTEFLLKRSYLFWGPTVAVADSDCQFQM